MEFKIERNHFLKGLSKVESIISPRDIKSSLSNILVEVKDKTVTLTASDFEITLSTVLSGEVTRAGTIAIPARKLYQIVSELQTEEISLSVKNEDNNIKIKGASEKASPLVSLMGFSAEDYPLSPSIPDSDYKEIPKDLVIEMINHVAYAMAKEDARYVFNGLYIVPEGKMGNFVATDGRRLSLIRKEFPNTLPLEESIILPHKAVRELQKLTDEGEVLSLAYNNADKRVHFKAGNTSLFSKTIDGNFPDYNQVIPKKVEYEILLNKENLESSMRQVAVMAAEPTRQVRFKFNQDNLYLHSSTPDVGEAEDNLAIDYKGEEIETAFNSRYIMEVLKVIESENVVLGISSSASPASIQRPGDKDFVAIVMPMKI